MSDVPVLEARQIGRRAADGTTLLSEVSLQVRGAERWAITGPTGAGKTLFLRALSLLDEIDAGEILWNGKSISNQDVPAFRRSVIYLHQRPVLFEGTVEQNLQLPFSLASARNQKYDGRRILDLLKTLERDESFLKKQTDDLSGGESQITALLRAVQLDPNLLLLDEPTAALDAASTHAIEALVDRWMSEPNQSRATLWVSHDPGQIERIADRKLILEQGKVKD